MGAAVMKNIIIEHTVANSGYKYTHSDGQVRLALLAAKLIMLPQTEIIGIEYLLQKI